MKKFFGQKDILKKCFTNTLRVAAVMNLVSLLQLRLLHYFPLQLLTNSVVMVYGRYSFIQFHRAAFLTRTSVPIILHMKTRQCRNSQADATEPENKAGRIFFFLRHCADRQRA